MLELANSDPLRAKELESCTYTELAIAYQHNRHSKEGIGYRVKTKGK